jgi:hypothetical protein
MDTMFKTKWEPRGKWKVRDCSQDPDEYMYPHINHQRSGYAAGIGVSFGNAVEICEGFSSSGSGKGAFGETKDWANVHITMQFPEDCVDTRRRFTEEVKIFIDGFMEREKLEVNNDIRSFP